MKTKALISFAATGKLVCFFVFAYMKKPFFHDMAHFWVHDCLQNGAAVDSYAGTKQIDQLLLKFVSVPNVILTKTVLLKLN